MPSTLPPAEADHLRSLRNDLPLLRTRVVQLHQAGWTYRAIGTPLGSPRSTVRAWYVEGLTAPPPSLPSPPVPSPPLSSRPSPPPSARARTRALRPDVPLVDRTRIARLAPLARRVRGGTPPDSPYAQAKLELDSLVLFYARRGVSRRRLADLAGVTYRAMSVRLEQASSTAAA